VVSIYSGPDVKADRARVGCPMQQEHLAESSSFAVGSTRRGHDRDGGPTLWRTRGW
jgi:hypothetical protein